MLGESKRVTMIMNPFKRSLGLDFIALLSQVSMEKNLEYDCTEDSRWDNCLESASVLAQLRLNQALNNFLPPNGLYSDTWQVGPSVSQQDAIRYLLSP